MLPVPGHLFLEKRGKNFLWHIQVGTKQATPGCVTVTRCLFWAENHQDPKDSERKLWPALPPSQPHKKNLDGGTTPEREPPTQRTVSQHTRGMVDGEGWGYACPNSSLCPYLVSVWPTKCFVYQTLTLFIFQWITFLFLWSLRPLPTPWFRKIHVSHSSWLSWEPRASPYVHI